MHSHQFLIAAIAAGRAWSSPIISDVVRRTAFSPPTDGFYNPRIITSSGGHAICASGIVPVFASTSSNVHLNIRSNATIEEVTQIILNLQDANHDSFLNDTIGPTTHIQGTYNISARLCWPVNTTNTYIDHQRVQLLTHGVAFDQTYWDFPNPNSTPGAAGKYSYIDFAALNGEITFTYDRLGVGGSAHPDPIQTVQAPLEVEILRSLTRMLRSGEISNAKFTSVIGIGHSFGSALTAATVKQYSDNFDAIVLTGFESVKPGGPSFTTALNLLPQSDHASRGESGYLIPSTRYGVQTAFFAYPDFEPAVLDRSFRTIQTTTLGEQTTMGLIEGAATSFTNPVFVLDGEQDLIFCNGNCSGLNSEAQDFPSATLATLFPRANKNKSRTHLLRGAGHGINLAANANLAFSHIQTFLRGL